MAMKTSAILITGRSSLVVRRMATREPSPKRMVQAPPQEQHSARRDRVSCLLHDCTLWLRVGHPETSIPPYRHIFSATEIREIEPDSKELILTRRDSPFLHVTTSVSDRPADQSRYAEGQMVVPSHHEEDRSVPLAFPFLADPF